MNAVISNIVEAGQFGQQIPEIPAQRKFISAGCQLCDAHSNNHKRPY